MKFDGETRFGCLIIIVCFLAALFFSAVFFGTMGMLCVVALFILFIIKMFSGDKSDSSKPIQSRNIDVDKLRQYMLDNDYAGFFVGDLGGFMAESADIENASADELIEMAKRQGIDLRMFEV